MDSNLSREAGLKSAFLTSKKNSPGKVKETDCTNLTALSKEDLLLAHNEDFVTSLLGENPDDVLMTCFELKNEDGSWNRFDPTRAIKSLSLLRDEILLQGKASFLSMEESLKAIFLFFRWRYAPCDELWWRGFCLVNDIVIGIRKL